ncbi:hypothetical protein AB0I72_26730 [Nocardiopsis sp. NPDC049922]|uniref:hypothetical protein n=1 Tax=Nocardiopsis sp. NPDC049922 TaxID=3155157 RepID=UPI0033DFFE8F
MATKTAAKDSKTTDEAQNNEANEGMATVEFKGDTYTVPSALDLPWEILEAIRANNESAILAGVLGDDQLAQWREHRPTIREGLDFLEKLLNAIGFDDLGN